MKFGLAPNFCLVSISVKIFILIAEVSVLHFQFIFDDANVKRLGDVIMMKLHVQMTLRDEYMEFIIWDGPKELFLTTLIA